MLPRSVYEQVRCSILEEQVVDCHERIYVEPGLADGEGASQIYLSTT